MRGLLAAAILAIAAPAAAQDQMTQSLCLGIWDRLTSFAPAEIETPQIIVDDDGWCAITDQAVTLDVATRIEVDLLRWRGTDFARFVEDGLPPRGLDIEATGFGVLPQTGDAVYDYLLALQTGNVNRSMGLSLRWDGVQNAIIIDQSYVNFFVGNRIEATGRIDGVDLTDMSTLQASAATAGLRSLQMRTTFDGWFEAYLAFPLGITLLTDFDTAPEAQVARLTEEAVAFLATLPETVLPVASRDALTAFLRSLPTPRGTAQLQLSADPVIGVARVSPFMLSSDPQSALEAALDGVTLLFTWAPDT